MLIISIVLNSDLVVYFPTPPTNLSLVPTQTPLTVTSPPDHHCCDRSIRLNRFLNLEIGLFKIRLSTEKFLIFGNLPN